MTTIHRLDQIKPVLNSIDLVSIISEGFIQYSKGNAVIPPVGELVFNDPPGDTHIKYGYIKNQEDYVIKIASGFYDNKHLGLPPGSGLILVFSQKTGAIKSMLMDEGHLTNVRTAVAGQLCTRYFAPGNIDTIGMLGTGTQARLQAIYSAKEADISKIVVWGRSEDETEKYVSDMRSEGFVVKVVKTPGDVAKKCRLIITTTPSQHPLLKLEEIQPETHITAIGSDTPEKQELDSRILASASRVITDSFDQCLTRGEISKSLKAGMISKDKLVELGHLILQPERIGELGQGISVADLTGVAVQDIQIASAVCNALERKEE